jgi:hypothetical protein
MIDTTAVDLALAKVGSTALELAAADRERQIAEDAWHAAGAKAYDARVAHDEAVAAYSRALRIAGADLEEAARPT